MFVLLFPAGWFDCDGVKIMEIELRGAELIR